MFENNPTVLFRLGPFHFLVLIDMTVQSVQCHHSLFVHQAKSPEGRANKLVKHFSKPFKDLVHSNHEHQKVVPTLCTTKSSKQKEDDSISPTPNSFV
jgi:nicotinamidase-related amidase